MIMLKYYLNEKMMELVNIHLTYERTMEWIISWYKWNISVIVYAIFEFKRYWKESFTKRRTTYLCVHWVARRDLGAVHTGEWDGAWSGSCLIQSWVSNVQVSLQEFGSHALRESLRSEMPVTGLPALPQLTFAQWVMLTQDRALDFPILCSWPLSQTGRLRLRDWVPCPASQSWGPISKPFDAWGLTASPHHHVFIYYIIYASTNTYVGMNILI